MADIPKGRSRPSSRGTQQPRMQETARLETLWYQPDDEQYGLSADSEATW